MPLLAVQQVASDSYFDIISKGGPILIPIAILSLVAVFVIFDRLIVLRKSLKEDNSSFLYEVKQLVATGKSNEAIQFCEKQNTPTALVISEGLHFLNYSIEDIKEAMEVKSREALQILENRMTLLSLVASVAPMLGFLGTIMGVIKIFYTISITDNLSIGTISDGLYQKMICSAAGLLVGIVAFIGYHLLNRSIDRAASRMEKVGNEFIFFLKKGR
jgi:biopolymer transport protein ExbB